MAKRRKKQRKKTNRVKSLVGALGPGVTLLKRRKAGAHKDKRKQARAKENERVRDLLTDDDRSVSE